MTAHTRPVGWSSGTLHAIMLSCVVCLLAPGGQNWTQLTVVLPSPANGSTQSHRQVIVGKGPNPPVLLLGPHISVSDTSANKGMPLGWRSIDGGLTWAEFANVVYTTSFSAYNSFTEPGWAHYHLTPTHLVVIGRAGWWGSVANSVWAFSNVTAAKLTVKTSKWELSGGQYSVVQASACYDVNRCVATLNASPNNAYSTSDGTTWALGGPSASTTSSSTTMLMPTSSVALVALNTTHGMRSADLGKTWSPIEWPWGNLTHPPFWNRAYPLNSTHFIAGAGGTTYSDTPAAVHLVTSTDNWATLQAAETLRFSLGWLVNAAVYRNSSSAWVLATYGLPTSRRAVWKLG